LSAVNGTVLADRYVVERHWINQPVTSAAPPEVRQQGDTTIYPVLEEVVVVEKRLMLREEVHVTRVRTESRSRQTVTLRTEKAEIRRHEVGVDDQGSSFGE